MGAAPAIGTTTSSGRAAAAAGAAGTVATAVATAALLAWSVWRRPDIALALVVLGIPFTVLEWLRPLRRQAPAFRRPGAATDALSFVVNEVVGAAGLALVLVVAVPLLRLAVPGPVARTLAAQPGWARGLEAFAISEVCGYWGHRLSHEVPLLWRFHRVHHSAPELDWLAPSRRHPLDAIVARLSTSLPVLVLGFGVPTVVTFFALKRIQGLLVHANVRLRVRPLHRIVVTPFFHHWHHSAEPGTWNTNYAGSLPVVDWLFGTIHLPDHWPAEYGADGIVPTDGYVARVLSPWRQPPSGADCSSGIDTDCADQPPSTAITFVSQGQ